jgi:predicted ABC-type exoprotein transport system permease subunit
MPRKKKAKKVALAKKEKKSIKAVIERDIEATLIIIIGLLGIVEYFGWVNLNPLNWKLLSPVLLLALGLIMLSGLIDRFLR